jgi:hypothetical protein
MIEKNLLPDKMAEIPGKGVSSWVFGTIKKSCKKKLKWSVWEEGYFCWTRGKGSDTIMLSETVA